jgi:hypothetical protein
MLSLLQVLAAGCALRSQSRSEQLDDAARFEFRESTKHHGVVIGAPHGAIEPHSDRLATVISERTGAGLVVAYGFKARRLSVTQPLVKARPYPVTEQGSVDRLSVFADYRRIVRMAGRGRLQLYVGVRKTDEPGLADRIEVVTSGLTHEEARALKETYLWIRDQRVNGNGSPKIALNIEPVDRISWPATGVKHHGILLYAERGLNLRVPSPISEGPGRELYGEILAQWLEEAIGHLRENPLRLPQMRVRVMDWGRFELTRSRRRLLGVVVGAPHGSFDRDTGEMVKQIGFLTGMASVVAKGFTPTEAGGWRINVNRPTEKTFPSDGKEVHTPRARDVYRAFEETVLEAAAGELRLYVDIHRYNTGNRIQVATVGISRGLAQTIKDFYHTIRDRHLSKRPAVPRADLSIEPLEEVAMRASGAKTEGILAVAARGLHFELPSRKVFATDEARDAYTQVLAELLLESLPVLLGEQAAFVKGDRDLYCEVDSDCRLTTLDR